MTPTRWRDRWVAFRNARLGSAGFQRWAADFPPTRPIAISRTRALFDLVSGFVYSQALAACVRLRLLEHLQPGPKSTPEICVLVDLPAPAAERLLGACVALGLVERAGPSRWALGGLGAALLGSPGLSRMIAHHDHLYADLADSVALLRREHGGGELAAYWPYATSCAPGEADTGAVADYSTLMTATQPAAAADILDAYPITRHRRLLDVGGGQGAFLAAAAARAPALALMLFDLPAVTDLARERLAHQGLLKRVDVRSGNFLADALPAGADLITLIRILHDHDDDGVARLLSSARAALPDDGALLIAEPMSGGRRADRVGDVYFAFYLQAMGRGRARSPEEIRALLKAAGFRRTRILRTRTPFLLRAILAQP